MTLGEQWNALENYHTFFDEVAGFAAGRRRTGGALTPRACRN
ncbi:MAG: hypothetical protein U5K74_07775 [Gemmatimonadaceae bacterium]|nr:hypothetical protein [Gemmatimonadaceae bacterium]